jgi:N6-adenosine-specific RNA methylase IME4
MSNLDYHAAAEIFPLMTGEEYNFLVQDIRENGLRESIWLHDNQIIDGRNRFRACIDSDTQPHFREYDGEESQLIPFVVSMNLHRRHLSESQRAMVAAKLANMPLGGNRKEHHSANLRSASDAAAMLNVSERSVDGARKIQDQGVDELKEAVTSGLVSVNAAQDIAGLTGSEQSQIVAKGEKEILLAAKQIRAGKAEIRRAERIEKIAEISKGNMELGTGIKYPIIYADPPWRYENPPMGGNNRSIENHYPTMTLDEIIRLPVEELATPDCLLYLWATAPKLSECMEVIKAWGFEYRTNLVWIKDKIGMGYHARNQHEILLIAKRGEFPPPSVADRPSSVFYSDRQGHSEKPLAFYEFIENAYPELSKIELFSRSLREGWAAWGNQAA